MTKTKRRKPASRNPIKRRLTKDLRDRVLEALELTLPEDRAAIRERTQTLAAFELDVLTYRIFGSGVSRTELALKHGIGQSQAEQLERRMIIRVLAIAQNRRAPA